MQLTEWVRVPPGGLLRKKEAGQMPAVSAAGPDL